MANRTLYERVRTDITKVEGALLAVEMAEPDEKPRYHLVPVVPCEHGNVFPHGYNYRIEPRAGGMALAHDWCDGKPEADDD